MSSPPPSSYQTAEDSPIAENFTESSADSITLIRAGRTILLLGAPRASSLRNLPLLDIDNSCDSLPGSSSSVDHVTSPPLPGPTATEPPAAWRILPLKRKYLHTGFSQRPDVYTPAILQQEAEAPSMSYSSTAFTITSSTAPTNGDEDLTRSFAAYNIPSPVTGLSDAEFSFASTTTDTSPTDSSAPPSSLPNIHSTALTDLQRLPTASYLKSIVPQTMSISAIVGIIHISAPRTFVAKRYNIPLTVQTLLVGDETSAGFKLDLWLPSAKLTPAGKIFMATVGSLRVGDVIFVQNMGLGFWDNQVNGATLRKDHTRIELVYRVNCFGTKEKRRWRTVDVENISGEDRVVEKVKKVVEWVRDFVGAGDRPKQKKTKEGDEEYEGENTQLPEDTQVTG